MWFTFDPSKRNASQMCKYVFTGRYSTNKHRNQLREKRAGSTPWDSKMWIGANIFLDVCVKHSKIRYFCIFVKLTKMYCQFRKFLTKKFFQHGLQQRQIILLWKIKNVFLPWPDQLELQPFVSCNKSPVAEPPKCTVNTKMLLLHQETVKQLLQFCWNPDSTPAQDYEGCTPITHVVTWEFL